MANKSTGGRPAKAVQPEPEVAAETADDGAEAAATAEAADEAVPMNRAERRAKGRGKSATQAPGGRGKVAGSHGPVQAQRNWANRRSG